MSTRCGSLDPGIIIHLLRDRKLSIEEIVTLLYERSGLLGLSGVSGNMQTLLDTDAPAAAEAIDFFVYRIGREIGSLAAALGGLDTLVFTAGIGENSSFVRKKICSSAGWLCVEIDDDRNERDDDFISTAHSKVDVLVIPTDEERAAAEQAVSLGI
jgi:acetate kinase